MDIELDILRGPIHESRMEIVLRCRDNGAARNEREPFGESTELLREFVFHIRRLNELRIEVVRIIPATVQLRVAFELEKMIQFPTVSQVEPREHFSTRE